MKMKLLLPAIVVMAATLGACASIGRPQGGPRDETPPVFVRSNPAPGATGHTNPKLDIVFNENLKLEDVVSKVVVSPAQVQMPSIQAGGRHLTVELKDTLLPNTTYTIDFSDAIRDLNEGNILDGFAIDFSTGDTLDSLRISGYVLQAENLEPAQGILVGAYSNLSDTALTTLPMERIARTNQLGQFTIRNLKEGTYNVFAVNDMNRDYHWDRSEDIAFYPQPVTPWAESITVTDTLRSSTGTDSIVTRDGTSYFPNDLLLTWFNEGYKAQYIKNYSRPDSNKIIINFAAATDSLPQLTIVNGVAEGLSLDSIAVLDRTLRNDSLIYWLTDAAAIHQDTMSIAMRYLRTDTLDQLSWTTDTLKFNFKAPKPKKQEKRKKDEEADTLKQEPEPVFLDVKVGIGQQELDKPLMVSYNEPLVENVASMWKIEVEKDSAWRTIAMPAAVPDSTGRIMNYSLPVSWEPGTKYRVTVDSAAMTSIYGHVNKPISQEITTKTLEDYSSVTFTLSGVPDSVPVIVQLLNTSDAPVKEAVSVNGVAKVAYVSPGTYYARAIIDTNRDGKWTTGNVNDKLQPEDVYYYPKKINLKKNWEIKQDWNLDETPVDLQKPNQIKKNKPKNRDKSQERELDEEEELGLDDMGNPGYDNRNPFDNRSQRNNRGRNNSFNNGMR